MPELNFFLCKEERDDVIEFCLSLHCRIIPHMHYATPEYHEIKDFKDYRNYGIDTTLLSIVSDQYSFFPLEMDSFEKENEVKYFITQRYGGPAIDFYTPLLAEIENNKIGPGFISYYPFYYNRNEVLTPNSNLKNIYDIIVKRIKEISIKKKIGTRNYWIGKHSIKRYLDRKLNFTDMSNFDWSILEQP